MASKFEVGKRYYRYGLEQIYINRIIDIKDRSHYYIEILYVTQHKGKAIPLSEYNYKTALTLNPQVWKLLIEEEECPNCKRVVEQDMLGLCPECAWVLKGGTQ